MLLDVMHMLGMPVPSMCKTRHTGGGRTGARRAEPHGSLAGG